LEEKMSNPRILIAEDNRIIAEDIKRSLERFGYEISAIAASGEAAIKKAREGNPDLVLMDIVLEGALDGIEAAQEIRNQFKIPVVFLTAYADEHTLLRAKLTEPYGYIMKPFEDRGLYAAIEITLSKYETEKKLKQSEQFSSSLLTNAPNPIIMIDPDTSVRYVNPALERLTGFSASEIIGVKAPYPWWAKETLEKTRGDLEEAMSRGVERREELFQKKDGERFWVEITAQPIRENGQLKYCLSNFVDITERKRAEETLRESEERYRSLVQSTEDSIYLVDRDCRYLFMNRKHLSRFGLPPHKVIGRPYAEFHSEREIANRVKEVFKTVNSMSYEYRSERDGGYYIRTISPVKELDGEIIALTVVSKDINKRKQAEEELRKSKEELRNLADHLESVREEERTAIAREIHDELGQALTGLKMDLSWVAKRIPEDQTGLLEKLHSMSELTGTTLKTVQRISTELRPGLLDDLGLAAAIEWQTEEFENRTGIRCTLTVDPEDIEVDEKRSNALFRILQETLTNVARHAQATRVQVSLTEKEGILKLRVRDNGKGITKEQISDSQSLGIIGIRERVHQWGGTVKISGRPGKGTTVVIKMQITD
jgi:PAS domain S-box-containing protein